MKLHTPRPWAVSLCPDTTHSGEAWIVKSPYSEFKLGFVHIDGPDAKANAELIERAVNSYAELLAACEFALVAIERAAAGDRDYFPRLRITLRAAIVKATGGDA